MSKDTFRLGISKVDSNFFNSLRFYRKFLSSQGYHNHDTFRVSAYYIYIKLLKPFEKEIENKSLLIIPDGEFSLIPFDALVDKPFVGGATYYYPSEPYLIKKYPIGYSLSASLYVESFRSEDKEKNKTLAIAPDYRYPDGSKADIPFLRKHLRKLTFFKGKYLDGEKATETNFKKSVPLYNIIHIYAHGKEKLDEPFNSKITFDADSSNDGILYAYEVGELQLKAKLVVLASCYSGSGKVSEGEGVLSMGRSFISAGASSVVMSLWYAYLNIATEQIWTFQKQLLIGERKDRALQIAKLKYIEKANGISGHPKEWASLIVTGNQEPLCSKSQIMIVGMVALVIIFGVIFLIIRRKRGRKG